MDKKVRSGNPNWVKGQSGNPKGGKKGHKGGSGRPPEWLKDHCRNLVDQKQLVQRLASIGAGELVDTTTTIDGRVIPIPAPMTAQVKAIQELLDRGFGKAPQSIDVSMPKSADEIAAEEKRFERLYGYIRALRK